MSYLANIPLRSVSIWRIYYGGIAPETGFPPGLLAKEGKDAASATGTQKAPVEFTDAPIRATAGAATARDEPMDARRQAASCLFIKNS